MQGLTRNGRIKGGRKDPHLVQVMGAPGSGKHTVAKALVNRDDYVLVDFDAAVQYHPRYHGMWKARKDDATFWARIGSVTSVKNGASTGVPAMTWSRCNGSESLQALLAKVVDTLIERRYNVLLLSHGFRLLWDPPPGYRIHLAFVGVPEALAVRRSRDRALQTGKFIAATLAEQAESVREFWAKYRADAPTYARLADTFTVGSNKEKWGPITVNGKKTPHKKLRELVEASLQ